MLTSEGASPVLLLQSLTSWPARPRPEAKSTLFHPPCPICLSRGALQPGARRQHASGCAWSHLGGMKHGDQDAEKVMEEKRRGKFRRVQIHHLITSTQHSPLQRKVTFACSARESKWNGQEAVRGFFQYIIPYSSCRPVGFTSLLSPLLTSHFSPLFGCCPCLLPWVTVCCRMWAPSSVRSL